MSLHPLLRYALRRIATGLILVFVTVTLVFAAVEALPGDAASAVLGRQASPEQIRQLSLELGLEKPPLERYVKWLGGLLTGDLGESMASRDPVTELIAAPLRNTLVLAAISFLILVPLAFGVGVYAGVHAGRVPDKVASAVMLGLAATPEFVIGTVLALVVGVRLKWLPPVSLFNPQDGPLSHPAVLVLPVATLVLVSFGYAARIVRASMAQVMQSEYVSMARLNGIPERQIVWRYGMRNVLAPSIQMIALILSYFVAGVLVVETVFQYPGVGLLLVRAAGARDLTLVQSMVAIAAVLIVSVNIVADVLIVAVTPRLRTSAR